ncbi:MAG: hypothetical protein AAB964_02345 [Patescibacteria group bacterium]
METAAKAYIMTCSCGGTVKVEARNRAEATARIKAIMDEDTIALHMDERHPGEEIPEVSMVHEIIDETTEEE